MRTERCQARTSRGVQWFVEMTFEDAHWYRDRARIDTLVDRLATAPWFGDFDVFAPAHRPGVPFRHVDEVRRLIARDEGPEDYPVAIFARGEPRMTVDTHEAEVALALSFNESPLEIRLWFAAASAARHEGNVFSSVILALSELRRLWPDVVVTRGCAFPRPFDAVRYRRTRPMRLTARPLNAVVDVFDRDCREEVEPLAGNTLAIIDASVPVGVQRLQDGRLVANFWLADVTNPVAFADACSRHEQWAVPLVRWQLAPGWNELGDLEVIDDPRTVDVSAVELLPAKVKQNQIVVVGTREDAIAMRELAAKAGFARIVYRAADGKLWDPFPPGDWVE